MGIFRDYANCGGDIDALHPGPDAAFAFPTPPRETDAERLARYECELLDLSIEQQVHAGGREGTLAVQIIALRATVRQ